MDIKPLIAELRDRVSEELDYALEAQAQQVHAEEFEDDPDVVVPAVVHQCDQVLVTEWIEGIPLSEVIADGTQEQRDRAGQLLARFLFSGPARTGLLHADPHPGNFRLLPADPAGKGDWRLGVLDFGTVDRLPGGLPTPIGDSLRMTLDGDAEAVYELLRAEGFVKESIELDPDAVLDYLVPIIEPAQVDEFTFTRGWMRSQAARIRLHRVSEAGLADPRSPAHQLGKQLNLPPAYLLIHRVTLSTIGVLCQLGATVRLREELEEWLPGFVPEDEYEVPWTRRTLRRRREPGAGGGWPVGLGPTASGRGPSRPRGARPRCRRPGSVRPGGARRYHQAGSSRPSIALRFSLAQVSQR